MRSVQRGIAGSCLRTCRQHGPRGPVACLGGGLGCSSTPLAQAVLYIMEDSGSGPASPWFDVNGITFSRSIMHGMALRKTLAR